MNHPKEQLLKKYTPMTETAFYILFALQEPLHGYGIMKKIKTLSKNRLVLSSGTMYGTLKKMLADELIQIEAEHDQKKTYRITKQGKIVLDQEIKRIQDLYTLTLS